MLQLVLKLIAFLHFAVALMDRYMDKDTTHMMLSAILFAIMSLEQEDK